LQYNRGGGISLNTAGSLFTAVPAVLKETPPRYNEPRGGEEGRATKQQLFYS